MFYRLLKKISRFKIIALCFLTLVITTYTFSLYILSLGSCNCSAEIQQKLASVDRSSLKSSSHKLAVLIPFRDRFEELLEFVPYMNNFLDKQLVNHQIYALNQVDKLRFNRASLINVGFKYSSIECDYIAMHDVDLLPLNNELKYNYPENGVFHIASPELHPRYHYPTFVGGILLVKREDFKKVNGMSNKYWGWGLEDDEFFVRLKDAKINVNRPVNISSGIEKTFRHIHERQKRKRDMEKCYNQREVTRRRDRTTGLDNVEYKIQSIKEITIDSSPVTVLNIELQCDTKLTPWCDCSKTTVAVNNNKNSNIAS